MNTISFTAKAFIFLLGACLIFAMPDTLNAQVATPVVGIPSPHGGELGQLGVGVAAQSRTRIVEKGWTPDANAAFTVGLGDTKKLVGLSLSANIFGLSNETGSKSNFGAGTLDVQINRAINDYIHVGAGVRATSWDGGSDYVVAQNSRSYYVVSDFIIPIHRRYDESFSLLFITAGAGNGIYRLINDFDPLSSGQFNLFGSVALQVLRGTNAIVEWNGSSLSTGISVYPFRNIPYLGATLALTDLTLGGPPRLIGSVGYFADLTTKRVKP